MENGLSVIDVMGMENIMNKSNTEKLFNRFNFFKPERPITEALMAFGFEHEDGWFDIIWNLCEDLEVLIKEENIQDFEVVQVKEKFGSLRFYTDGGTNSIYNRINKAEGDSSATCEKCGKQPAKSTTERSWIKTLCEECSK